MKPLISFTDWGKFILPLIIVFIVEIWRRYRKYLHKKNYVIQTLKKNSLANDETKIYRSKIKWPNKSSSAFKEQIDLICELFQSPRIIDFQYKNHTVYFKEAKFPSKVKLNHKPALIEVGRDHDNKPFIMKDFNVLVRVSSGGGKTIFINNVLYSYFTAQKGREFEIVIADPHQSFSRIDGVKGIDVYDSSTTEEKERLLKKLKAIKEYQRDIDLSYYETLEEAQANGQGLDKKSFLVVIDEFSESFTNANSKDPDYKLNQDIISVLKDLLTSGRKYSQRVLIAYQSSLNSMALIAPTLFQAHIYSYTESEVADAKGLPITHPLLKQSGNFYYVSKKHDPKFFRTCFIEKKNLFDLLTESKQ